MTKLSNTTSTCEPQWKMLLLQVFTLIYLTAVCAAQDVAATSSDETTPMPTTHYANPQPTVNRSPVFDIMYPGESITFTCNVDVTSEWKYEWYKDENKIEGAGSNKYEIASVTSSNKGEYQCKVKRGNSPLYPSDKVSVQVSANNPQLTVNRSPLFDIMYPGESIAFTCNVDGTSEWKYEWYKDENKIEGAGSNKYEIASVTSFNKGEYQCKVKRGEGPLYPSDKVSVQVSANNPQLTVNRSPLFDIMYPGESIAFTCNVDGTSEWKYEWYKDENKIEGAGSNKYEIASVTSFNKGEYQCKVKRGEGPLYPSDKVSVQVSANNPQLTVNRSPVFDIMYPGESIAFTCNVDVTSEWKYEWYKDENKIEGASGNKYEIASVASSNKGEYQCKVKRGEGPLYPSDKISVQVSENKAVPKLTRNPVFTPMYPGESITFTCGIDASSEWEYEWFLNRNKIPLFSRTTYIIVSVTHADGGEYQCRAKRGPLITDNSGAVSLQVSDPPTPILKLLSNWSDVFENEGLKFSCELSEAGWTFSWHRDQTELQPSSGSMLEIKAVKSSHQGKYTCKAHLTDRGVSSVSSNVSTVSVYDTVPIPTLSRDPTFDPMYVGETVKLKCTLDVSTGWSYHWYTNGINLNIPGKEMKINLDLSHNKIYYCKARRGDRTLTGQSKDLQLHVREIPVPLLEKKTQWMDVFPSEGVELSCKIKENTGWIFTWHKDAEVLSENTFTTSEKETLSISNASPSHRGNYSCSGKLKGRSVIRKNSAEVTLHVYDEKPTVTLRQAPKDSVMHTSDYISFTCDVNVSSGWEYQWYKDGSDLKTNERVYKIPSAKTSHSGSYQCQVKRGKKTVFKSDKSRAVNLKIAERPKASIILLTGWSEVFSTDSLLLKCEVIENLNMSYTWNFTWYKEGKNISQLPSQTHKVTPQDDPEQSRYTCKGFRNGRPEYSEISDSYKTKNLLLKRRILLSISGCIFFGIIAVFLGCIALRVFRKPVAVEDRQDEANLFLTMAQLKDRNDAPCPLVEYITDEDLNQPPKEGEENGTNCSETTPLPIASTEEQAVTSNGKEATQNGSGMVSFQH